MDELLDNVPEDPALTNPPVGKPLNETELQFVTFMHQCWGLHGEVLSKEQAFERYAITPKLYDKLMGRTSVRTALAERGIDLDRYSIDPSSKDGWKTAALSPIQLLVANSMLDLVDTRSYKKKLQDLNVSTSQYQAWLSDPVFSKYLKERTEAMLGEGQYEAHLALMDKVKSGDIRAIAYFNEMTGRFVPESSRGAANTSSNDVQGLLVRILEIIIDEVDDPDVALRISERFKTLSTARTIAGQLIDEDEAIVKPEIAPARELTPALKKLASSGEGYQ